MPMGWNESQPLANDCCTAAAGNAYYFGNPTALVVGARASGGGRMLRVADGGTAIGAAGTNGGGIVSDPEPGPGSPPLGIG